MKNRSFLMYIVSAMVIAGFVATSFTVDAGAVIKNKSESKQETTTETTTSDDAGDSKSNAKTDSNTDSKTDSKTQNGDSTNETAGSEKKELTANDAAASESTGEATSNSNSNKSNKSSKSSSGGSNSSKVDENGNTILMTQAQRRKKFMSKTNPKRDEKVATVAFKPNLAGFTYADFNTCNSYNSENGLGGKPIYLVGTITDIEKVYENTSYYGTAILVNDMDGFQWYMRAEIAKDKYDLFRNSFLGKAGYIYGIYSGYSGVTNRPMMDITVLQPDGTVPFDLKIYK